MKEVRHRCNTCSGSILRGAWVAAIHTAWSLGSELACQVDELSMSVVNVLYSDTPWLVILPCHRQLKTLVAVIRLLTVMHCLAQCDGAMGD